ncbi:hypothetical protein K2X92_05585 [Candidatus Gracilibacteria bacterium]|nr:hypothetical protein [Candidatus Gracilibacteria bacterium]
MNIHSSETSGDIPNVYSIEYNYNQGKKYQDRLHALYAQDIPPSEDEFYDVEFQIESARLLSKQSYLKALSCVGSAREQCLKIDILFFLMEMLDSELTEQDRVNYFYKAVEIARQQLGDNYVDSPYGNRLLTFYIKYIDPTFADLFKTEHSQLLTPLIHTKILTESNSRIHGELEKASDIATNLPIDLSSGDILSLLEEIFGPLRIIIRSKESGEIVISRNNEEEILDFNEQYPHIGNVSINIFDSLRQYQIIIDRGSTEPTNQFKTAHLEHIIYPILQAVIQKKEYEFGFDACENTLTIHQAEEHLQSTGEVNDYTVFIREIISQHLSPLTFHEAIEDPDRYIDECIRAIDICRVIRSRGLGFMEDSNMDEDAFLSEIDHHLGGTINRNILDRVKSMLLSCIETMNGIGAPFGLQKTNIPLEGKIYSIIRNYEGICSIHTHPKIIHNTMKEWSKGGYFDTDIFNIFLGNMSLGIAKKQINPRFPASSYRKNRYQKYLQLWRTIISYTNTIEDFYYDFRKKEGDKSYQNTILKKVNEQYAELVSIADIKKILIIKRHAATDSDTPEGPPGDDNEPITLEGELATMEQSNIFRQLQLHIYSSPFLRARQTSAIICQRVRSCTRDIVPVNGIIHSCQECPGIVPEVSIGNPAKNIDNGRYNSALQKFFVDNTNGMMEFLLGIISSSQHPVSLFVVHRDSGRHMMFWLKNLFSQKGVFYKKVAMDNDTICQLVFRGNSLVDPEIDIDSGRSLIFSIFNWKELISLLNELSNEIYGKSFYIDSGKKVNIIALHNSFLDFIDQQNELFPEKTSIFLNKLQQIPELSNIGFNLEYEDIFIS